MTEAIKRAMGDGRTFDPARTFWHLLFPLGAVEERVVKRGGKRRVVRQSFDAAFCGGLVANERRRQDLAGRHGASAQPFPVSRQHAIEERIYEGVPHAMADLARDGNGFDLHFVDRAEEHPAGVYALIEWVPSALEQIEAGAWMTLSPTTVRGLKTTAGDAFEGDVLGFVGLVDMPALDTIGTARDHLPHDAFPTTATPASAQPRAAADAEVEMVLRRQSVHFDLTATDADEPEAQLRADDDDGGQDMADVDTAAEVATEREAEATPREVTIPTEGPIEDDVLRGILMGLSEWLTSIDAKLSAGDEPEPEETDMLADDAAGEDADAAMNSVVEAAERKAVTARYTSACQRATELTQPITGKILPPGSFREAVKRLVAGKEVDDLLIDTGIAARKGSDAVSGGGAPTPKEVTEAAVLAEARAAKPSDVLGEYMRRCEDYEARGVRVVATEEA